MLWFIFGLLIFVAWGLERYLKLFSRITKGMNTIYVSAALLGVFLLVVIAEAINGNYLRSIALLVLAVIAYYSFRQPDRESPNK